MNSKNVREAMPEQLPAVFMPKCDERKVLKGQKALVTGASSGIGKAIVIALCRAGADVVINYHSEYDAAKATAEEASGGCEGAGRAIIHQADVSKEDQVQAMFKHMYDEFGTIDILVPNAGLQQDSPFENMTLQQWNTVIGINLTGQFLCCREAIREFKKRGVKPDVSCAAGKIICMSSVHEVIPWAGHVNYAASKGGVMLMMKSIAQEVAPFRIRVNAIGPGAIRTPINRDAWEKPEAYRELLKLIPYKRIGEPEDVARAAVWLASDEADYITGTTLFIDGGMTLYPGFEAGG
ncbi:MAG TPA: SDR family oxidoreductase [Tepidisphaeraceae bacterium]|nr:SDR family oxidoreductase [Tepidisphaeraceae bacterium]